MNIYLNYSRCLCRERMRNDKIDTHNSLCFRGLAVRKTREINFTDTKLLTNGLK